MDNKSENKTIEERFEYKGYPCVVKFMPWGYRCGYVGISEFDSLYDIKPEDLNMSILCHGGISYDGRYLLGDERNGFRWIGFDCHHVGDGCDYELAKERYSGDDYFAIAMNDIDIKSKRHSGTVFGPIRDKQFVIRECEYIVDQLIVMERKLNKEAYNGSKQCECKEES